MKAKGKAYVPDACKQCAFQEHIFHCVFVLPSNIYVLLATLTKKNIMRREEKKGKKNQDMLLLAARKTVKT